MAAPSRFSKLEDLRVSVCQRTGIPLSLWFWWVVAAAWGIFNAQLYRDWMNPDGISYLDLASEALKNGPHALVNPHWGPLYPGLIALWELILRPAPADEFAYLHGLNAVIYLVASIAFGLFLRELILFRAPDRGALPRQGAFIAFAFALFCLYTNGDILPFAVTPDILLSATVFGAAACYFHIWRGSGTSAYVVLGCVLALGYLSKSVMLPIGIVLVAILLAHRPSSRLHMRNTLLAGAIMLLLCTPQIVMISARVGHPSIGETGRLNYLWWVQGIRKYQGWTGTSGGDMAIHGPRLVMENPEVLEFGQPIAGTYPLWYDPAYWYAGAKIRFDPSQQWTTAKASLTFYKNYFPDLMYPLAGLVFFVVLTTVARRKPSAPEAWFVLWPLSSLLVYALFTTEVRYVAPWLILFWVGAYSALWARNRIVERLFLILLAAVIITPRLIELSKAASVLAKPRAMPMDVRVAQELDTYGIHPGDSVALVGTGFDHYYARIARVRIVAQVTNAAELWSRSQASAERVEHALAGAGAKALIARFRPAAFQKWDWHGVPDTPYSFLILDRFAD